MNFGNLFGGMKKATEEPKNNWIKCPKCLSLMYYKEVEAKQQVCPKCSHHFRINAFNRIAYLADEGSFVEHDSTLAPVDPLKFTDKKSFNIRVSQHIRNGFFISRWVNRYADHSCHHNA